MSGKFLHQKLINDLTSPNREAGNIASSSIDPDSISVHAEFQTNVDRMLTLVRSTLAGQQQELVPQPSDEAWGVIHDFDAQRMAGHAYFSLLHDVPGLADIAENDSQAANADAALLKEILTRPIDPSLSLEKFLANKVEIGLCLFAAVPPNPDCRMFNSMLPGLAVSTSDYSSVCRTLLLKGATHLIGIPSAANVKDDQLTASELDRKARLQTTMFSFSKDSLTISDFNAMIDPLNNLNVYESHTLRH
jgi:hypothetical protein